MSYKNDHVVAALVVDGAVAVAAAVALTVAVLLLLWQSWLWLHGGFQTIFCVVVTACVVVSVVSAGAGITGYISQRLPHKYMHVEIEHWHD